MQRKGHVGGWGHCGRKEVAQVNYDNVDSLTAWHCFEWGLPLEKMHKRMYGTISGRNSG